MLVRDSKSRCTSDFTLTVTCYSKKPKKNSQGIMWGFRTPRQKLLLSVLITHKGHLRVLSHQAVVV